MTHADPDIAALHRRIDDLERKLKLQAQFGSFLAPIASSSASGETDAAATPDNDPDGRIPLQRVEPYGFAGVPPSGVLGWVVSLFRSKGGRVLGGVHAKRYRPADLAEGESAQYSSANPKAVLADTSGNTKITSATPPGSVTQGDVTVNGGTAKVGRVGDSVNRTGTFAFWVAALRTAITGVGGADPGDCPVDIGTIGQGADHFKA